MGDAPRDPPTRLYVVLTFGGAACLMFLARLAFGVVVEPDGGGGTGYRMSRIFVAIVASTAVPALGGAVLLWRTRQWTARGMAAVAFAMALFFPTVARSIALDRVVIGDERLLLPMRGFFPSRPHLDVAYAEVAGIVTEEDAEPDAKGRRDRRLRVHLRDGRAFVVPVGDLLRPAMPALVRQCDARGVAFLDE